MKISKKLLITIICAAVALSATVGGTLAYIISKTAETENSFEPVFVSCSVEESFDGVTKSDVKVKNTGDISAYVRATVIVMWTSESGAVHSSSPVENVDYTIALGSLKWTKGSDGFYYYSDEVSAGAQTELLISSVYQTGEAPAGYTLTVHIAATAIQSTPSRAVVEAWGATVQPSGKLTAP